MPTEKEQRSLWDKASHLVGPAIMLILALIAYAATSGSRTDQLNSNTQAIQRLEQEKADRREIDDVKHWMQRLDEKIDHINDKLDNRK